MSLQEKLNEIRNAVGDAQASILRARSTVKEAGNEIERLRSINSTLLDAAVQALDYIEGYVDVVDGDYGQPAPNKAMKAYSILKDAIEKAERK